MHSLCDAIVDAWHHTFALFNHKEPIRARQTNLLDKAARPMNLNPFHCRRLTQAEMKALVVRGLIAAAAHHVAALPDASCSYINSGPYCIARALGSPDKRDPYPMVLIGIHIAKQD